MSLSLTPLLEEVINRMLRLDPETLARLGEMKDKVIRLRLAGVNPFDVFVSPFEQGLRLRESHDGEPDVTISGNVPLFAKFILKRIAPEITPAGEVQLSGDIELGQRFQRILEKLDIDWEEQAARVLGDVAAHQLGNAIRGFARRGRQGLKTLGADAAEYMQEESRLLPTRLRVASFREAVESLRQEADRLERRIQRLREVIR